MGNNWTSFRIFGEIKEQKEYIKELRPFLSKATHYNYNYYSFPYGTLGKSHLAVRVVDKEAEEKIVEFLDHREIEYAKSNYGEQDVIAKAYELGSRCADLVYEQIEDNKIQREVFEPRYFIHILHGLLNDLSPESEYFNESELYAKLLVAIVCSLKSRIDQIIKETTLKPKEE